MGSSKDISARWDSHRKALRRGRHANPHLQAAWVKYGEAAFGVTVLALCSPSSCISVEQRYLDALLPEYNIARIAGSRLGLRHSAATRAEMSRTRKGRVVSAETRAKLSAAHTGKVLSEATRTKVSAAKTGRPAHPNCHSPETNRKISETLMGHAVSADSRAKLRANQLGKPSPRKGIKATRETCANLSAAKTGVPIAGTAVVHAPSGATFRSITAAARALGFKRSTLDAMVRGRTQNWSGVGRV